MMQAIILFSGTVQGVGFRYTTLNYAREVNLMGWVKNLSDGRVEICAQGSKKVLKQFIDQVKNHFQGYITDCEVDFGDVKEEFKNFQIIH